MERQKRPEPLREERRRGKREVKKPIEVIGATEERGTEGTEGTEGIETTRTGTTKTTRITRNPRITRNTKSTRIEIGRKTETTGRGRAAAAASEDAEGSLYDLCSVGKRQWTNSAHQFRNLFGASGNPQLTKLFGRKMMVHILAQNQCKWQVI
jgi:hypothetical protein